LAPSVRKWAPREEEEEEEGREDDKTWLRDLWYGASDLKGHTPCF